MGTFSQKLQISSLDGEHSRDVEAMVDTGATYTVLPRRLLMELGVSVTRQARFELADGRLVDLDVGEARATVGGTSAVTQVAFGEDDTAPLLGAVTLEELLLAVDPVKKRLASTHAILY